MPEPVRGGAIKRGGTGWGRPSRRPPRPASRQPLARCWACQRSQPLIQEAGSAKPVWPLRWRMGLTCGDASSDHPRTAGPGEKTLSCVYQPPRAVSM